VANAHVFQHANGIGPGFMTIVRSNLADAEREFGDDGIDEVDRV
jgi:hypothetical protein